MPVQPSTPHKNTHAKVRFTPYKIRLSRKNVLPNSAPRLRHKCQKKISQTVVPKVTIATEINNKSWRLYRVSPLFDFSLAHSRAYRVSLSSFIEAESSKSIVFEQGNADKAEISELREASGRVQAIKILLLKKDSHGAASVQLSALLCKNKSVQACDAQLPSCFTSFPVMIVKGPVALTRHLVVWLQMAFDCAVQPVRLSPVELSWMAAMWATHTTDKSRRALLLEYNLPADVAARLPTNKFPVNPDDCKKLWASVNKQSEGNLYLTELEEFMQKLQKHIFNNRSIDPDRLSLKKVVTAVMMVSSDGRLKITQEESVYDFLDHVLEVVQERTCFRHQLQTC